MKKAIIIASVYGFISSFERSDITILQKLGYEVYLASNMSRELGSYGDVGQMDDLKINKIQIDFQRNPLTKKNFRAYKQLNYLLSNTDFDLIHCHTPIGGVLSRLCNRKNYKKGKTKIIYTAHGFHFYKGAPIINWIIYFTVEWICSFYTNILITLNKEDFDTANKYFKTKQISYIHGVGLDKNKFDKSMNKSVTRNDLKINPETIVLLSVGELSKRKNHKQIIKSLEPLKEYNFIYLIVGAGPLLEDLQQLVQKSGLTEKVRFIGYRNDVSELYKLANVFCFPSINEGLSVALMEAMYSSLPVICSKIRGNVDLIVDGQGGYLCGNGFDAEYTESIRKLFNDVDSRHNMGAFNKEKINDFDLDIVQEEMKTIYNMIN